VPRFIGAARPEAASDRMSAVTTNGAWNDPSGGSGEQ